MAVLLLNVHLHLGLDKVTLKVIQVIPSDKLTKTIAINHRQKVIAPFSKRFFLSLQQNSWASHF